MSASCPSTDACNRALRDAFPGAGPLPEVVRVASGLAELGWTVGPDHLRPNHAGEAPLVNGPAQMMIADTAAYVAVWTLHGVTPMALTSSLSIDFLRAARGRRLRAVADVAKAGRTLVVVNTQMFTEAREEPVSQAVVVYALPVSRN